MRIIFIFFFLCNVVIAENIFQNKPLFNTEVIPSGYAILDSASGDLNLDQYSDLILILKKNNEDSSDAENPGRRPLLILLGQEDKSYKLVTKSDNAVYCSTCGGTMGDPYQDLVIKNGSFSMYFYGGSAWRWSRSLTFKYSKKENDWLLSEDKNESFHTTDPNNFTSKTKTSKDFGKILFINFDINKIE